MAKLPTYSSRNVQITWAGHTFMGLADNGVEITPTSDVTDEEVGMDKSVQVSFLPDETGTVVIKLQQNSPTNQFLAAALELQRRTGDIVRSNMTISDPSASIITVPLDAHIKGKPTLTRGKTATGTTMDWTFFSPELLYEPGTPDNNNAAQIVADVLTGVDILEDYLLS